MKRFAFAKFTIVSLIIAFFLTEVTSPLRAQSLGDALLGISERTYQQLLASHYIGFTFSLIIYFVSAKERYRLKDLNPSNIINIIYDDFWFDKYISRRVISFIYFLIFSIFNSFLIFSLIQVIDGNFPQALIIFILAILTVIFMRILLEFLIVQIRSGESLENVSELLQRSDSFSKIEDNANNK